MPSRAPRSQRRIQKLVYVGSKLRRIDRRQGAPSLEQPHGLQRAPGQGPQLGHRIAVTSHRERLPANDTVEYLPAVVAEIPDCHFCHRCITRETLADDGGYGAWCPDLPGCVALADTEEAVIAEMRQAIEQVSCAVRMAV
jgi:hypothetical protein